MSDFFAPVEEAARTSSYISLRALRQSGQAALASWVILLPVAGAGPAGQHPLPDLAGAEPHLHRVVPQQGYTFNITNSTSYDQYYVHGRTVFEVMVRITDDIFNTYLRKRGTVNPYYSEYCDGKSVHMPGAQASGAR